MKKPKRGWGGGSALRGNKLESKKAVEMTR